MKNNDIPWLITVQWVRIENNYDLKLLNWKYELNVTENKLYNISEKLKILITIWNHYELKIIENIKLYDIS
jgi:hypothetical protein